MSRAHPGRRILFASLGLTASLMAGAGGMLFGVCGPFTDVSDAAFCPFVLEIFTLGITTGTTPTTYDPAGNVSRLQMAAFLSRTVDGVVKRGHPRAAQERFWNPQNGSVLALTTLGGSSTRLLRSDGTDVWVADAGGTVSRIRVGDGRLLEGWTGAVSAYDVAIAAGRVVVTGFVSPGRLYAIDPTQPSGAVTTVATLPNGPRSITFDGAHFWTGNQSNTISIITPGTVPWTVTTVTTGSSVYDVLFDGSYIWTANAGSNTVFRVDTAGTILQSVTVGDTPEQLAFDGTNIWVANFLSDSVTVFRASSGAVLQTLTGNGLKGSSGAAFDGERILVTNQTGASVSLWKAADLTPLGFVLMPFTPVAACSDGAYFWIAMQEGKVARF